MSQVPPLSPPPSPEAGKPKGSDTPKSPLPPRGISVGAGHPGHQPEPGPWSPLSGGAGGAARLGPSIKAIQSNSSPPKPELPDPPADVGQGPLLPFFVKAVSRSLTFWLLNSFLKLCPLATVVICTPVNLALRVAPKSKIPLPLNTTVSEPFGRNNCPVKRFRPGDK